MSGSAPQTKALGAHMAFVLFIGAANSDATPAQRDQLRDRVRPLLDTYRVDGKPRPVLEAVFDVMGPQWQPSAEWKTWIDGMLS